MAEVIIDIIQRAKTFQIFKWHYRPMQIYNPYKLASCGYQCVSLNVLQCHICHNSVSFTTLQGIQRSQQQITQQLQNHDSTCEYYGEQGKQFTKPQLYLRMDQLIQNVKQSYRNKQQQKLFPLINYTKFQTLLRENNQTQMLNAVMAKSKLDQKQIKISFILTIMGWSKKNFEQIQCAFCGRCINIKQFKITTQDKQNIQLTSKQPQSQLFDLFQEHRYFCFWIHEKLNGWEIYIQHLFDKLGEAQQLFKNKDPEDIKKIRTLIDVYLQNFKNTINENFQKATKILTQCSTMAQELESTEETAGYIFNEVMKRRKQMGQFLEQIQSDVRVPLKRVKID